MILFFRFKNLIFKSQICMSVKIFLLKKNKLSYRDAREKKTGWDG